MKDEEMAEEYEATKHYRYEDNDYCGDIEDGIKEAFLAGLKAGRPLWHYPSKGEYPKEGENVLCYCKGSGFMFCCVGNTIVGGDNKVRWWSSNKSEELRVIAWCEIPTFDKE